MKKWLSLALAIFMVFTLCACGSTSPTSQFGEGSSDEQEPSNTKPVKYDSYEAIFDDYTVRLQDATPGLIGEYKAEATNNTEGLQGLATICNTKISKLAAISTEGISEMAEYYYSQGNGSYDEYSEWTGKLQDVYTEEAGKIQDAYMESAK